MGPKPGNTPTDETHLLPTSFRRLLSGKASPARGESRGAPSRASARTDPRAEGEPAPPEGPSFPRPEGPHPPPGSAVLPTERRVLRSAPGRRASGGGGRCGSLALPLLPSPPPGPSASEEGQEPFWELGFAPSPRPTQLSLPTICCLNRAGLRMDRTGAQQGQTSEAVISGLPGPSVPLFWTPKRTGCTSERK